MIEVVKINKKATNTSDGCLIQKSLSVNEMKD